MYLTFVAVFYLPTCTYVPVCVVASCHAMSYNEEYIYHDISVSVYVYLKSLSPYSCIYVLDILLNLYMSFYLK